MEPEMLRLLEKILKRFWRRRLFAEVHFNISSLVPVHGNQYSVAWAHDHTQNVQVLLFIFRAGRRLWG